MTRTRVTRWPRPKRPRDATRRLAADCKPMGLWYEVDGGWRRWCASEMPEWLKDHFLHRVTLGKERMLYLRASCDLDAFTERFAVRRDDYLDGWNIDWPAVAADYDGIEIAPYCWNRRLDGPVSRWYYGWDCASGCIWRPRGVTLRPIGPVEDVQP